MPTKHEELVAKLSEKLHPDAIRSNLVRAGLFLAGWEMLKSEITKQVRLFYGATVKGSWGNYSFVPDDEDPISRQRYAEEVLALDTGKKKGKIFRASLRWLVESEALTETQPARVQEMERHRNEVAHELMKVVVDPDHQGVDVA